SEPLQSGNTVDIITAPGAQPNPAWLNFVVTAKARANIRHVLKHRRRAEAQSLGKRLLDKALVSLGGNLEQINDNQKARLLAETGADSFERILEEIGLGNRIAFIAARQLLNEREPAIDGTTDPAADTDDPLVI